MKNDLGMSLLLVNAERTRAEAAERVFDGLPESGEQPEKIAYWIVLQDASCVLQGSGPMRVRRGDKVFDGGTARSYIEAGCKLRAVPEPSLQG